MVSRGNMRGPGIPWRTGVWGMPRSLHPETAKWKCLGIQMCGPRRAVWVESGKPTQGICRWRLHGSGGRTDGEGSMEKGKKAQHMAESSHEGRRRLALGRREENRHRQEALEGGGLRVGN